jgi:membrane protease YdiL (CAAX protease family)
MRPAPSTWRSIWLFVRLRFVRRANLFGANFSKFGRKDTDRRTGTEKKKRTGWLISGLILLALASTAVNVAREAVLNLHAGLDEVRVVQPTPAGESERARRAARPLPGPHFSAALERGLAMELSLLFLAGLFGALGSRELARPDWDMEWLATLPLRTNAILWSRIVERTMAEPFAIFTLWPICAMVAWYAGYRWSAPLVGALGALALLPLSALLQTIVDTGLRLAMSAARLRNVQAALSIAATVILLVAMSTALAGGADFGLELARRFPQWAMWTPPGLVVRVLTATDVFTALSYAALLVLETAALLVLGVRLLHYQLRGGMVTHGGRDPGRRPATVRRSDRAPSGLLARFPMQRRELTLLGRDRNFLIQTLVLPVLIIGGQVVLNTKGDAIPELINSATAAAALAFATAAYVLQFSALQALNSEGGALWLLYSFPRSIESLLKEKARLWGALAVIYPVVILIIAAQFSKDSAQHFLGFGLLAVLGVPIYATIGVALSVFANNPLAEEANKRVRLTYLNLFLLLSAIYVYALAAAEWWQVLVFAALAMLLALALWQKARDELPYLLDPTAAPPARVSASDGLMAAMLFFVVQVVIAAILMDSETRSITGASLLISYVGAGAVTYALARFTYWRAKTQLVPAIFGRNVFACLRDGVVAGTIAAVVALVYITIVPRFVEVPKSPLDIDGAWMVVVLAVVAAPIFEEFIFRGLIFGGLRRTLGLVPSVLASAAVFAVVHPPLAIVPVFILGVCTALAYERSKVLLAPMIAHAIYNGIVVGLEVIGR